MEILHALAETLDWTAARVGLVPDDMLHMPTPCTVWVVRRVA